jgi:hypothetical protein
MNKTLTPLSVAVALALAGCGTAAPPVVAPTSTETAAPAIDLPPAWTATPSLTIAPASPTVTATLHPAALAARETAALWPPIEIVAVGAGADSTDWQRVAFESGSILVPPTFEVADLGGFDEVIVAFMRAFSTGLVQAMNEGGAPVPGEATATPIALSDLDTAFDFDFLMAEDPVGESVLFLIGGPFPGGYDLESMMTQAVGSVQGEVEIVNRESVGGAPRRTGRVFLRVTDPRSGTTEDEVIYVIVEGDRAWTLVFQGRDFEAMLPTFETSALSLTPAP